MSNRLGSEHVGQTSATYFTEKTVRPFGQSVWQTEYSSEELQEPLIYSMCDNVIKFSQVKGPAPLSDMINTERSNTKLGISSRGNSFQGWNQQRFNKPIPVTSAVVSFGYFVQYLPSIGDVLKSKQETKYLICFSKILQEHKTIEMISRSISGTVLTEIEKRGLKNEIYRALTFACQEYRNLNAMSVAIKHDPEIAERTTIRIILTVSGTPENVLDDEKKFKRRLFSSVEAEACKAITVSYNWKD